MSALTPPAVRLPPLTQAVLLWRDPIGQLLKWKRRHGELFVLELPATGALVVVGESGAAQDLLVSDPRTSRTGVATGRVLPLLGPRCILRQDGEAHRQRRRTPSPAFRPDALAIRRDLIAAIADRELSHCVREQPTATLPTMQTIAFAVITQLVLGAQDPGVVDRLQVAMRRLSSPAALAGTWTSPVADGWVRERMGQRWHGRRDGVNELLAQIVAERRSERALDPTVSEDGDVLDLLLDDTDMILDHPSLLVDDTGGIPGTDDDHRPSGACPADAGMSDNDLTDELLALLMVGHETTASALGWAVDRLAHDPEVARRLRESVAEGDTTYLRAFIRELLRWRPPVIDAVRELSEPTVVLGHALPAATLVVVSPALIHHDPRVYTDPDAFRPERFLTTDADDRPTVSARSHDWMPFGGGRRHCLGAELAQLEMGVVLSRLVQSITVAPAHRHAARSRLHGTMVVPSRGSTAILRSV